MLLIMTKQNATYYGKTERHNPSGISDHLLLYEHDNSSFNNLLILCCENNAFKLSLRGSILIKRETPGLNSNVSAIRFYYLVNYCIITNGI